MFKGLATIFLQRACAAVFAIFICAGQLWADAKLLMAEEPGCIWCARWNEEIGTIYPKTKEGQAAPLRRVNIRKPLPDDIELARALNFTPTFVLLVNGKETRRIEGYPGEDFFWGLLGQMLDQEDILYLDHNSEQRN